MCGSRLPHAAKFDEHFPLPLCGSVSRHPLLAVASKPPTSITQDNVFYFSAQQQENSRVRWSHQKLLAKPPQQLQSLSQLAQDRGNLVPTLRHPRCDSRWWRVNRANKETPPVLIPEDYHSTKAEQFVTSQSLCDTAITSVRTTRRSGQLRCWATTLCDAGDNNFPTSQNRMNPRRQLIRNSRACSFEYQIPAVQKRAEGHLDQVTSSSRLKALLGHHKKTGPGITRLSGVPLQPHGDHFVGCALPPHGYFNTRDVQETVAGSSFPCRLDNPKRNGDIMHAEDNGRGSIRKSSTDKQKANADAKLATIERRSGRNAFISMQVHLVRAMHEAHGGHAGSVA